MAENERYVCSPARADVGDAVAACGFPFQLPTARGGHAVAVSTSSDRA